MYHEKLFANAQQLTLFCLAPVFFITMLVRLLYLSTMFNN